MDKRIRIRSLLLGGLITLLFLALWGRVYWVQVAHAAFWSEEARKTWMTTKTLIQERGTITDRDGNVLAADAVAYTVALGPSAIQAIEKDHPEYRLADQIASKMHAVLGASEDGLRKTMTMKLKNGKYYAQRELSEGFKVDKSVADRITAFRDQMRKLTKTTDVGIYLNETKKRYYPNGSLASQVLGYVDWEEKGTLGIEKSFDEDLKGEAGKITYEKDGIRTQLPDGEVQVKPKLDGKNVTLTLDRDVQYYMEQAMKEAYDKYHPVSMTAIAADPNTMDILGMVSLPSFDPGSYGKTTDMSAFKNNAVQSLYEPGSTFKIVTLAAAVQEGVFHPTDTYMSGSYTSPKFPKPIRDVKRGGWGPITYLEGLKHSSNVAFVKLGYEMLGKDKMRKYIDNFGFGVKTNIELPGEVIGKTSFNYPIEVATATFGQGVTVTPIQQVAAVAAVANGGKLMEPHIVKSVTDPNTGKTVETQPKMIRQVISPETSRLVGGYLEQVVSDQVNGTGKNAYIPGYRIAGKTGTAQVVVDKNYSKDQYVVSFIGYAPVENPKIVLYVLIDRAEDSTLGGGSGAAPIFKKIMEQSLRHFGIMPNLPDDGKDEGKNTQSASEAPSQVTVKVSDVSGLSPTQAREKLSAFTPIVLGKGSKVLGQLPKSGSLLKEQQQVYLMTESTLNNVPSLKGLSMRDALEMCGLLGGTCTVKGNGYVTAQQATRADGKLTIVLTLTPPLTTNRPETNALGGTSDSAATSSNNAASASPTPDPEASPTPKPGKGSPAPG